MNKPVLHLCSLLLAILIVLSSCTSDESSSTAASNETTNMQTEYVSLQGKLDEKKNRFEQKAPDATKELYARGIQAVVDDGVLTTARNKGDKAPNFTLKNALGNEVALYDQLKNGPVVLTWYRGGWCPYCNLTVARLQEELPAIKAAGGQLIALTPELPDSSLTTIEKNKLAFEVLSDYGNVVAKEYGIVFQLIDELGAAYQNGFDLHGYNGDESNELPLPATYVIDTDGTITYAFLHKDYRNRAEPSDILTALRDINKP